MLIFVRSERRYQGEKTLCKDYAVRREYIPTNNNPKSILSGKAKATSVPDGLLPKFISVPKASKAVLPV
jgi:hypothetical protein